MIELIKICEVIFLFGFFLHDRSEIIFGNKLLFLDHQLIQFLHVYKHPPNSLAQPNLRKKNESMSPIWI